MLSVTDNYKQTPSFFVLLSKLTIMNKHNIRQFLSDTYPELSDLFSRTDTPEIVTIKTEGIPEAMVTVITNQMLSGKAAATIVGRIKDIATDSNKPVWQLSYDEYRKCGLSNSKANAVIAFKEYYLQNRDDINNWFKADTNEVIKQITSVKGIGIWSATIIAMFYLGKEDLFPYNDGTLVKITGRIEKKFNISFDPEKASPYKSYLAMYMWQFEDNGLI